MKINACVNGTFRYPQYIGRYEERGVLNAFYFAHRRETSATTLGLTAPCRNNWPKETLLQLAFRAAPSRWLPACSAALSDAWQRDVLRHWQPCDSVEAVIGGMADRIVAHARGHGARVLGHPVTAHPAAVNALMGRVYGDLGLDPQQAQFTDLPRRLAEIAGCDRLIVDSPVVARSFLAAGVAADRIATITPGLDLGRFTPRTAAETGDDIFRVICVGLITPRKAQHLLFQAWRMLNLPRAELVLVGLPGRHAAAVVRGFEGSFVHRRHIPNAALREALIRASVFVTPSIEDGFGQAPMEALACGLPVIATENVGMSALLTDGQDGFVVPAFDAEAIANRIELLYRDRERLAAMSQAAAVTGRRSRTWPSYVDRVIAEHRRMAVALPPATEKAA